VHVVLTVKNFDNGDLHALVSTPGAVDRLAAQLTEAIRAKNMDGANLDFEGTGGADRAGYANFASTLARTLHAANPNWQVTVDTYASSASDTTSFFDIPAIAPAVDAFFVMAYDMYGDGTKAQPNAPLDNYGFNDTAAMSAYTAVVPASKVLLGTPFYGYDFTVVDDTPNSKTTGTPAPQTYAEVRSSGHPLQWDTAGSVPFVSYQGPDRAWHEVYFDNPQSLALKAQLVNRFKLLGLGVWALGMDGNDPAMMAALLGHAAPLKLGPVVRGSAAVLPPSSAAGGPSSSPGAPSQPGAPPPSPAAPGSGSGSPKPSGSASPTPSGSGPGTPAPSASPPGGGGPSPPAPPTTPPTPPPLPTLG
jgi:spore germination protein YaaH